MIETLSTALILGFLAGVVPGPYTTVLASTALERGFRPALRLAFIPLATDVPAAVLAGVLLRRLNEHVLTGVGVLGGLALFYLGVRFFRRQDESGDDPDGERKRTFGALALAGLLSPAPWIFWLVAAGPLMVAAWNRGPAQGTLFVGILFAMLIGTAAGIAWLASRGRKVIEGRRRRQLLKVVGVALAVAGGVLIWQSYEGNFQRLIQRQAELRETVR